MGVERQGDMRTIDTTAAKGGQAGPTISRPVARLIRTCAAGGAFALVLLAGTGCAGRSRPFRLVPVTAPGYEILDGQAVVETPEYRIRVVDLDDDSRRTFIESRAHGAIDPFRAERDGTHRYLTFRLSIENLTKSETVTFQPQNILMACDTGERYSPLDYPEAYARFVGSTSTDPRLVEDLSRYMFDVGETVPAGETIEGLLVYPMVRALAGRLRMEFSFIQVSGASARNHDLFFRKETADR